jgi:uncharacterized protein involved in exopolysaccharide biosynthesis
MTDLEKEAGKLLKQCRKLKSQIDSLEQEFEADMKPLRENYRAKYTRLNQIANQLRKDINQIQESE